MQPEDFKGDPYAAVTNQSGHFTIGLALPVFLGMSAWWTVLVAAVLYWVLVEFGLQGLRLWRDSLMDMFNVMAGAAFGIATVPHAPDWTPQVVFLIWAAMLAFEGWDKQ